jgi:hypothetical protein
MANRYPLIVDSSSQQIKEFPSGDTLVIDNLQVTGTTTTLETATLNVEDKNITINYSTGDSSSTADGSGLTFQDAVDASTDSTILWNATNDEFDFSHGITLPDSQKITFGAGSDLQIYHTGSHSFVDDAGTGNLYIRGNSIVLGKYTGEYGLACTADGSTDLYYDNVLKLATTATGATVTGLLTASTSAAITQVALTSSSNAVAWDAQAAANAYHLLTENTTFAAPSNAVEGAIISVEIAQGGTPYTVAWHTDYEFAASTAPTMTATANKTDILSFRYNGSIWQEIGRVQNLAQT